MASHAENVFRSKLEAKRDIATMLWSTLGAAAMLLLPETLLSTGLMALYGYFSDEVAQNLTIQRGVLYAVIFLAAELLICQPLYFGLTRFLALRRSGLRPSVIATVTEPLTSVRLYGKSIAMALIIALHSFCWMLPTVAVCGAGFWLSQQISGTVSWFVFYELLIAAGLFLLTMTARYQCAYALLSEQQELSCWQAVRQTAKLFHGHKREVLSLLLTFSLWILLVFLCGGILMIYVYPYILLALFHLFDHVRGIERKQPETPENLQ